MKIKSSLLSAIIAISLFSSISAQAQTYRAYTWDPIQTYGAAPVFQGQGRTGTAVFNAGVTYGPGTFTAVNPIPTIDFGLDDGEKDHVIRTRDVIVYDVQFSNINAGSNGNDVTLTFGLQYDNPVPAAGVFYAKIQGIPPGCGTSSTLSADGQTLTCKIQLTGEAEGFLPGGAAGVITPGVLVNPDAPINARIRPNVSITDGSNSFGPRLGYFKDESSAVNDIASSPGDRVSTTNKLDLIKTNTFANGTSGNYQNDLPGVIFPFGFTLRYAEDKGFTPIDGVITFKDTLSGLPPGAELWQGATFGNYYNLPNSVITNNPANAASNTGTVDRTLTSLPDGRYIVQFTISGGDYSGNHCPTVSREGSTFLRDLNSSFNYPNRTGADIGKGCPIAVTTLNLWVPNSAISAAPFNGSVEIDNVAGDLRVDGVPIAEYPVNTDHIGSPPANNRTRLNFSLKVGGNMRKQASNILFCVPTRPTQWCGASDLPGNPDNTNASYGGYVGPDQQFKWGFNLTNSGNTPLTDIVICEQLDINRYTLDPSAPGFAPIVSECCYGNADWDEAYALANNLGSKRFTYTIEYTDGPSIYTSGATPQDRYVFVTPNFGVDACANVNSGPAGWVTDPVAAGIGWDNISKFRIKIKGQLRLNRAVPSFVYTARPKPGREVNEVLENFVFATADEGNITGFQNRNHVRIQSAALSITKSVDPAVAAAGSDVTWTLNPFIYILAVAPAEGYTAIVRDTIPVDLAYIPGSANITPENVTNLPDGRTLLEWRFTGIEDANWPISVVLPQITFDTKLSILLPNGVNKTNTAVIDRDPSQPYVQGPRSATAVVTVTAAGAISVEKLSFTPEICENDTLKYQLGVSNIASVNAGQIDLIDIIPYDGYLGSSFTGTLKLADQLDITTGLAGQQFPAGTQILYTKRTGNMIDIDPGCQSNGGTETFGCVSAANSTEWCSSLSGGSCPADESEVTGVRIITPAPFPSGEIRKIKMNLVADGKSQLDEYNNRFSLRDNVLLANVISAIADPIVVPTTCNTCVTPDAGADYAICLPKTTFNLTDASVINEWVAESGNPANAVVDATTGVITGMTSTGVYTFRLQKIGDPTCSSTMTITVSNGDAPNVLCNDGSTSLTLDAPANLTNVVWYNMDGTEVGTGNSLIVTSNTGGLDDGTEAYYYIGEDGTASGCDVELCCPIKFLTQDCCPTPNCGTVTVIKN